MAENNAGCGLIVLAVLALGYCTIHDGKRPVATGLANNRADRDDADDYKADQTTDRANDGIKKAGESRGEYEERQAGLRGTQPSFYGDPCTVDCGGHNAGRAWAEAHDISDPGDCGGRSWSFQEGCETYAEGQQRRTDDEEDREGG